MTSFQILRVAMIAAILLPVSAQAGSRPSADACVAAPAAATPTALSAVQQRDVLTRLADLLEARYLDPSTGARYARRLRAQIADGAYCAVTDPAAFGVRVTAGLQAVAPDRHLRLAPKEIFSRPRVIGDAPPSPRQAVPDGLEEAKMIGDVAFLRFNMFPADPASGEAARAFLLAHSDARAVIIDARPLRGGGATVMDALLPLFYAQPTKLLRMEMRASGPDDDGQASATMVRQPAPAGIVRLEHQVTPYAGETRLQRAPLYYLTSRRTASAGEHMALALKRSRRATLIGETTAGAGHFGWIETLPSGFAAFIPIGRTYDPDTGLGWEGQGVAPDVPTPADAALDEALARIGRAAVAAHP